MGDGTTTLCSADGSANIVNEVFHILYFQFPKVLLHPQLSKKVHCSDFRIHSGEETGITQGVCVQTEVLQSVTE